MLGGQFIGGLINKIMKIPALSFEQLTKAKETYNEISYQGFLLNVSKSFYEGLITKEEKDILLLLSKDIIN